MPAFPRHFTLGQRRVNAYRVFLGIGIFAATLVSAASAEGAGLSPLKVGIGCLACAIAGLVGARAYHLAVAAARYSEPRSWRRAWNPERGGLNVFGGLLPLVPAAWLATSVLRIPLLMFFDHLFAGVLVGGFWIRLGCVFNGCCGGRATTAWYGVMLADTRGMSIPRIPVQFMEMAWWALGGAVVFWLWPDSAAPGNLALAVLGWYGFGRFFLEPLREAPDMVLGRVRIDRVVAGGIAAAAAAMLIVRALAG